MKGCCVCLAIVATVGFIFLIAGTVFIPVSKMIIHKEINKEINLKDESTKKNWVKNPTPIDFQIWVWNLTNPDEVLKGRKPSMVQAGPYSYIENRHKVNITYHDDNDTVSYRELKWYTFNRESSVGPESDTFITINIPMMVIANVLRNEPASFQEFSATLLDWSKEDLFISLSIKDILWGYEEPLINKTVTLLQSLGLHLSIDDHFGLFKNYSDDGWYNVMTGVGDHSQIGVIKSWNYAPNLNFWNSDQCNMLNGTDATIFHPFVEKSSVLYAFSSDLCRSIYFNFYKDSQQQGIDVYRFTTPIGVFQAPNLNPANRGFCVTGDNNNCTGDTGLLNVENCYFGAPIVFSQPHFLNAEPLIVNSVDGMHPDLEEHGTYIDIEPHIGAAFYVSQKLQINIQLELFQNIKQTQTLPRALLPVLWLNESFRIDKSLADEFMSQLGTPIKVINIGIWVAICVGIALILLAIAFVLIRKILDMRNQQTNNMSLEQRNLVQT